MDDSKTDQSSNALYEYFGTPATQSVAWYNTTPVYDFMAAGSTFYRFNRHTGETWYQSYGNWLLVKEPPTTENQQTL